MGEEIERDIKKYEMRTMEEDRESKERGRVKGNGEGVKEGDRKRERGGREREQ